MTTKLLQPLALTLMAGRSRFVVAHDIEKVMSSNYISELSSKVPPGVYVPTMAEVLGTHTSRIEFDVLYFGDY